MLWPRGPASRARKHMKSWLSGGFKADLLCRGNRRIYRNLDVQPMENHKCIVHGKRPNAGYISLANNFATSIDALWKVSKDCSTIHTLATLLNELTCYIILENGNGNRKGHPLDYICVIRISLWRHTKFATIHESEKLHTMCWIKPWPFLGTLMVFVFRATWPS